MTEHLALRLVVGVFVKGSLALALAAVVTLALRRHGAAARHAVWTAAMAVLLALPALTAVLPRWQVRQAADLTLTPAAPMSPPPAPTAASAAAAPPHPSAGAIAPVRRSGASARPAATAALLLWLAGVAVAVAFLIRDLARVRVIRRRAWPAGRADRATWYGAAIRRAVGFTRPVEIVYSTDLSVPAASGWLRPVVFLPDTARRWESNRVRAALLHEMAHLARGDYLSHLLTQVARACYWPNPLMWLAARRTQLEQERACDDAVLRTGARSWTYAEHLVAVARELAAPAPVGAALAMARPHTLTQRIRDILRPEQSRAGLARRTLLWTGAGTVLVALPLGTVRLIDEAEATRTQRLALVWLAGDDPAARAQAAWMLGDTDARRTAPALRRRLADPEPQVRAVAAWALGEIGARSAVPGLVELLDDADPYVREAGVLALGRLRAGDALQRLAALAADTVMGVRAVLTVALERVGGPTAARILGHMVLRDPDGHTREMAMSALRQTDPEHAREVLTRVLGDSAPRLRASALHQLYRIAAPSLIPALEAVVAGDPEPMVRAGAAATLGATGHPAALPGLRRAQADGAYGVRVSANYALGALGGPDAAAALLQAMRDPVHQVRLSAVEALEAMRGR